MNNYTEEEAKTKWCPMVRCEGDNRHWGSPTQAAPISACVGSGCMMWRDCGPKHETTRNYHDEKTIKPKANTAHVYPDGWRYEFTDVDQNGRPFDLLHRIGADDATSVGYCGLAGKPS